MCARSMSENLHQIVKQHFFRENLHFLDNIYLYSMIYDELKVAAFKNRFFPDFSLPSTLLTRTYRLKNFEVYDLFVGPTLAQQGNLFIHSRFTSA